MDWDVELVTLNPLITNLTKWSNTIKQFVGKFPTNSLSVFPVDCSECNDDVRCQCYDVNVDVNNEYDNEVFL